MAERRQSHTLSGVVLTGGKYKFCAHAGLVNKLLDSKLDSWVRRAIGGKPSRRFTVYQVANDVIDLRQRT
jgi:hypothetical protein